ncbi:MAG: protein-export chaperone SecB [Clostridia bacterium]|nr:protein-export chaperone SecB [Clostridia bacterium]
MIDYTLRGLTADELSFKVNPMKVAPDTKFEIKPFFSRRIQTAKENPKINVVILECKIETSEEAPKPFNMVVRLVGVFEVNNMETAEDRRIFALNATETMYPYLRATVSSLTTASFIAPLNLPVISGATLFPEDRSAEGFNVNFDPKNVN